MRSWAAGSAQRKLVAQCVYRRISYRNNLFLYGHNPGSQSVFELIEVDGDGTKDSRDQMEAGNDIQEIDRHGETMESNK